MLVEPIGHDAVRAVLERELPHVTMLLGPKSVGKMTLARYLAQYHGILPVDLRLIEVLNMEAARDLKYFANIAPFGKFKLVLLSLDKPTTTVQSSFEDSLNAILKLLEEPPPRIKFILTCSTVTLPTVMSRSHVFRVGFLTTEQLEKVLAERLMLNPNLAASNAALGRGQVATALQVEASESAKSSVLSYTIKLIHQKVTNV